MHRRTHNPWLLLLLMVMIFCTAAFLFSDIPYLVKAFAAAVGIGGASVCLVEMTDFYMFGNEER